MRDSEIQLHRKIMNDPIAKAKMARAKNIEEQIETIVSLGKEHNLPVSPESARTFLTGGPEGELSDAELEMVVGGKGNPNQIIHGDDSFKTMIAHFGLGNFDDNLSGGDGDDKIYGHKGDDTIDGGTGNDELYGGSGNDFMTGGEGNDKMWGGENNDTLDGGAGNDYINGGRGEDTLYGGAGNDCFVFRMDDGNNTIKDFDPTQDRLGLVDADREDMKVIHDNGNTIVQFGHTWITLEGVTVSEHDLWSRVQTH